MHTIDELNDKLISELKELAEGLGVKNAKKLAKEELVYKILDQQAVSGSTEKPASKKTVTDVEPERKMRPRRRENVAPIEAAPSSAPKRPRTGSDIRRRGDGVRRPNGREASFRPLSARPASAPSKRSRARW